MAQVKFEISLNTQEETLAGVLAGLLAQGAPAEKNPCSELAPKKKEPQEKKGVKKSEDPSPAPARQPAEGKDGAAAVEGTTGSAGRSATLDAGKEGAVPEETPKPIGLTDVRAVATALSRAGKADTLKQLFAKYGADKLSAVKETDYPALMKDLAAANS